MLFYKNTKKLFCRSITSLLNKDRNIYKSNKHSLLKLANDYYKILDEFSLKLIMNQPQKVNHYT